MQGIFEAIPAKLRVGSVVFLTIAFSACFAIAAGPVLTALYYILGNNGMVHTFFTASMP